MVQLQNGLKKLEKAGVRVAAVSYDSAKFLAGFAKKRKISYPLLSDPDSVAIKALGILNDKAGGRAAGVPHPGTIIVDENGVVRAKIFMNGYRQRHSVDDLIDAVQKIKRQPRQEKLPVPLPKGAIVLFDGKGINKFVSMAGEKINWPIKDGTLVSVRSKRRSNHIVSTLHFRDADIHVEFMLPEKGSGNSGVYIHGHYEMQIFNSYGIKRLDKGMMGALYYFAAPLVNASRKPGEWQVYDIRYHAPQRDSKGKITKPGKITAWLNGKKVQDNTEFGEPRSPYHPYRYGTTPYLQKILKNQMKTSTGPVFLQDHDNPVRFRNVWVLPLDDKARDWDGE